MERNSKMYLRDLFDREIDIEFCSIIINRKNCLRLQTRSDIVGAIVTHLTEPDKNGVNTRYGSTGFNLVFTGQRVRQGTNTFLL